MEQVYPQRGSGGDSTVSTEPSAGRSAAQGEPVEQGDTRTPGGTEPLDVVTITEDAIVDQANVQDPVRPGSSEGEADNEKAPGEQRDSQDSINSQSDLPTSPLDGTIRLKQPAPENGNPGQNDDNGLLLSSEFGTTFKTCTETFASDALPSSPSSSQDKGHVMSPGFDAVSKKKSSQLSASEGDPSGSSSLNSQTQESTPDRDNQPEDRMQNARQPYRHILSIPGATTSHIFEAIGREKLLPPAPSGYESTSTPYVSSEDMEKAGMEQAVPPSDGSDLTSVLQREQELARDIQQRGQELARKDREQLEVFRREGKRNGRHTQNDQDNRNVNDNGNAAGQQMDGSAHGHLAHDQTDDTARRAPSSRLKDVCSLFFGCWGGKILAAIGCGKKRAKETRLRRLCAREFRRQNPV